ASLSLLDALPISTGGGRGAGGAARASRRRRRHVHVAVRQRAVTDAVRARAALQQAVDAVRARTSSVPDIAIVLGTGLGGLGREIALESAIPYAEIPHFPLSTVETHAGRLLFGELAGRRVVAMEGRFHRYEGYTLAQVTLPVRVMRLLGAHTL